MLKKLFYEIFLTFAGILIQTICVRHVEGGFARPQNITTLFFMRVLLICLFAVFCFSCSTETKECNVLIDSIIEDEKDKDKKRFNLINDNLAEVRKKQHIIDSILSAAENAGDYLKVKFSPEIENREAEVKIERDSIYKANGGALYAVGGGCVNKDTAFIMLEPYCFVEFGSVSDSSFVANRVVAPLKDFRAEKERKDFDDIHGQFSFGIYKDTGGECISLCKSHTEDKYLLMTQSWILDIDFNRKKRDLMFMYELYNWNVEYIQPFLAKKMRCTENGFIIEFYGLLNSRVVESDFFIEKKGEKIEGNIPKEACFELKDMQNPDKYWRFGNCHEGIQYLKDD